MDRIKSLIRNIPDFPKPGIQFKDISTLFEDKWGFKHCMDLFEERYRYIPIDKVAGIDARGFILGAALADRLHSGFVMIRKKGKLPYKTISASYELEYGTDQVEISVDAIQKDERILLVDDLIATGGTLKASTELIEKSQGIIIEIAGLIELIGLGAREKLKDYSMFSLIKYNEK